MAAVISGIPLGRYVLGERLAVGGMGEVFVAAQLGMGGYQKPLAVKLLLSHLAEDPRSVEMFLEEAHVAARMNHPNVVQIFDVGMEAERYFIAMELVRGVALSTLIHGLEDAKQTVSADLLSYVGRALCDGLQHAHEMTGADGQRLELVHRDVTPHNVMVSVEGAVKLTDFGIAKARGSTSHTRPGSIKGKLAYVAPEQMSGIPLDRRADVFGAGLTLFCLATLQSPFARENEAATLRAVERDPLPPLEVVRPDLPPELCQAIARAAAKAPEERFPSARAFRDALPMPPGSVAEELGNLVTRVCSRQLKTLEERTALSFAVATGSVQPTGRATVAIRTPRSGAATPPRRLRSPLILGALAAVSVLAVAVSVAWKPIRASLAAPAPPIAAPVPTTLTTSVAVSSLPAVAPREPDPPVTTPVTVALKEHRTRHNPRAAPAAAASPARLSEEDSPPPTRVGYVNIDADPWATVSMNGKVVGETPISQLPVEAGTATLVLSNPETSKSIERKVEVSPGRTTNVRVNLK